MYSFLAPKWRWNSRWIDHRFTFFFHIPPLPSTLTEIFPFLFFSFSCALLFFCESSPSIYLYLSTSTVLCQIEGKRNFFFLCEFFPQTYSVIPEGRFSEDWIDLSTHIFRAVTSPPFFLRSIFILFDFMVHIGYTQYHVIAMIH